MSAARIALNIPPAFTVVTATNAQNRLAEVLEQAERGGVVITKQGTPRTVIVSFKTYQQLAGAGTHLLDALTAKFDAQFARMQEPEVWAATERGFHAPLGAAHAPKTRARG